MRSLNGCFFDVSFKPTQNGARRNYVKEKDKDAHTRTAGGNSHYFIDWANAGEYPYFRDVGRITGIINTETLESFCPDVDCFLKEYYGIVNNMLNVDYEAFLLDIQMGQYIEVANQFTPPKRIGTQIFRDTSMYNEKTKRALDGLSRKIIGK